MNQTRDLIGRVKLPSGHLIDGSWLKKIGDGFMSDDDVLYILRMSPSDSKYISAEWSPFPLVEPDEPNNETDET
jgi:hypothetical protein